jgi:alcohol dehydrogenase class IV
VVSFEFATAARIVFGSGKIGEVPAALRAHGLRRVLVTTNLPGPRLGAVRAALEAAGIDSEVFTVDHEPTVELVRTATARLVREGCDSVLGLGGGSAIDTGKAVAALAANPGDVLEYLEVVGRGQPLRSRPLPFVAAPTTAGTGAEVTRNAVLGVPEAGVKVSLRSPYMLPVLAVVDPDLIEGLSPRVLAASGLDALAHLVESLVSCRSNPLCDGLAAEGLRRSARSLRRAFAAGLDEQAREDLSAASLHGGLCLANAGLGAVHGFAGPLGGMLSAAHGEICAALLPVVMEVNLRALNERASLHPALGRYRELAVVVTGNPGASAADGVAWVRELVRALGMPGLSRLGMSAADVPAAVAKAKAASSMRGNALPLSDGELAEIATRAL